MVKMLFRKLVRYNKIFKVWSLVGGCIKKVYKVNFFFLIGVYSKQCFFEFKYLYLTVKRYAFLLLQWASNRKLFIGGSVAYSYAQKQYNPVNYSKCLVGAEVGMLSNFYGNINIGRVRKSLPDVFIFLQLKKKLPLLCELKRTKNIVVGLVNVKENGCLVDYPIVANTEYFYSSYFFCRLLLVVKYFSQVK